MVEGDRFIITEATGAVPLVSAIEKLRKEIDGDCTGLSQKARKLSLTNRNIALRLNTWEAQLDQIRKATRTTHNLTELKKLRNQCEVISDRLAGFSKK
ncbi:hypothetical protein KKB44_04585 [Candidatus Micrarchaeota archaeon]|nr:hypothetical protein [Candidatus Micrarchaeota archaeon]